MSDCLGREYPAANPSVLFFPGPSGTEEPRRAVQASRRFSEPDATTFADVAPVTAEPELVRCLMSIRQLTGAVSARLLRRSSPERAFRCLAASGIAGQHRRLDDVSLAGPELAAVEAATAREPAWIGADGSSLLLPIDERPAGSRWLLLGFDRLNRAGRGRIAKSSPHLSALLLSMLDLAADRDRARDRERAIAAVMDQHDCGIIILRRDQTILFKNAAAAAILRDGVVVETQRGSLRPTAYHDAVRFQTALDCIVSDERRPSPKRPAGMVMLLKGRDDLDRSVVAVITPAGERGAGERGNGSAIAGFEDSEAAAVLYLMRPDQGTPRGLEPICQLHGLSPVETRLVTHLVAGLTISDAAAEMRIKPDTARAYLKQVFSKTGTHRQSSLVRIITRYQRAVRGDFDFRVA